MAVVGAGSTLAPRLLLAPFFPGAAAQRVAFLAVAVPMLRVAVAWQLSDAASMVFGETLRAAGDTAWPMRVRIAVSWGVFVPVTLLTARWGGGPVAALAVLMAWRFHSGAWRTMKLTGDEPDLGVGEVQG